MKVIASHCTVCVHYKSKFIVYCVLKKYVSVPCEGHFIILYNSSFKKHWPIRKHVSIRPFAMKTNERNGGGQ